MKVSLLLRWITIYSLLISYTYTVLYRGPLTRKSSFAYAVAHNYEPDAETVYMRVEPLSLHRELLSGLMAKMQSSLKQEYMLCSMSVEEFNKMKKHVDFNLSTYTVDATQILIAEPTLETSQQSILTNPASNMHCSRVNMYQNILPILSAHLS